MNPISQSALREALREVLDEGRAEGAIDSESILRALRERQERLTRLIRLLDEAAHGEERHEHPPAATRYSQRHTCRAARGRGQR
jgi:hypothetical protein